MQAERACWWEVGSGWAVHTREAGGRCVGVCWRGRSFERGRGFAPTCEGLGLSFEVEVRLQAPATGCSRSQPVDYRSIDLPKMGSTATATGL